MPLPYKIPNPFTFTSGCLATLILLCAAPLEAGPLQATVSGGLISGDLGGTAFTNASYTVTASYDPAVVQSGTLAGFPATYVGVTPTITIDTDSRLLSGTFVIVPDPSTMAALGIALVALAGRRRFTKA